VISPVSNGNFGLYVAFTLGHERTVSGFLQFRFEFRVQDFWVDSDWFVPPTTRPDTIRLMSSLWDANAHFHELLKEASLEPRQFFEAFNGRVSFDEHAAYLVGGGPLDDLCPLDAAYITWGRALSRLKVALRELMALDELCLLRPRKPTATYRYFAYRKGLLWESAINLKQEQWKPLIDAEIEQRGITVAPLPHGSKDEETEQPDRLVSVAVRREVWRRDQGRCAACGAQERLEFDHIVPVAMGGSNTARNIQLLCERCNRVKGPTLG
jgi:HNH endonuclease